MVFPKYLIITDTNCSRLVILMTTLKFSFVFKPRLWVGLNLKSRVGILEWENEEVRAENKELEYRKRMICPPKLGIKEENLI